MMWLLVGVLIWVALAVPTALVIGRAIRAAEGRRKRGLEAVDENFVATDLPPVAAPPAEEAAQPWTGPSTVPFAPSRLPWGGDRASGSRSLPPLVRHPVRPVERDPSSRDSSSKDSGLS